MKARIDKTKQNSKCRLCDDRDEMINPIISECSKLAKKDTIVWARWSIGNCAKTRNLTIWTNANTESHLMNETHKVICGFEKKMDHLISPRRLDVGIVNNNNNKNNFEK